MKTTIINIILGFIILTPVVFAEEIYQAVLISKFGNVTLQDTATSTAKENGENYIKQLNTYIENQDKIIKEQENALSQCK